MARAHAARPNDARTEIVALVKALPARDLAAARRYLEYLRDFSDAEEVGPPDVERAWAAEIKRRTDALESERTVGEDWSTVRARLKRGERA